MPYDEISFLNGLAAGLTATAGRPLGALRKTLMAGTYRLYNTPSGEFETFVSRVYIETPYPLTIVYEYGADGNAPERVFRRAGASAERQTLYHVVELPRGVPMLNYDYNVYLYVGNWMVGNLNVDAGFMAFPYYVSGRSWIYPGKPELVNSWLTRSYL